MPFKGHYPPSPSGRFMICGEAFAPHPYCITPRHVEVAAEHHYGILSKAAIDDAEKRGATCGHCPRGAKLPHHEHKPVLIVGCHADFKSPKANRKEVETWLKSILPEAQRNGYTGFAFTKKF